jgi:uncharacterized protein YidB (DUF937 family)
MSTGTGERESSGHLSPISRRAFFKKLGKSAAALGGLGVLVGAAGCDDILGTLLDSYDGGGYGNNCGYCNGCGRNYYHCDGSYCDYINYSDGCWP